ncbi:hypothetical protein AVXHC19_31700 [Acidovorax sacchari]
MDGDGDVSAAGRDGLRDVRRGLGCDGGWDWEGMEAFLPRGSAVAGPGADTKAAATEGRS